MRFAVFGAGIIFLIVLFLVVRLRATTHENADPVTEEPDQAPSTRGRQGETP